MRSTRYDGLAGRQAQWDAFHEWQQGRAPEHISLEERVAWYLSAFDFSRQFLKPRTEADLETKVQYMRRLHERLACLKRDANV